MIVIGIDPGTYTGIAVFDTDAKTLRGVETLPIHKAMHRVLDYVTILYEGYNIHIRVEDARKRKWYGKNSHKKLQGAGSIKRDCQIWEDFLKDYQIPYDMPAPGKSPTKIRADYFKILTGYDGQTSKHSRDAAMLVFKQEPKILATINELNK